MTSGTLNMSILNDSLRKICFWALKTSYFMKSILHHRCFPVSSLIFGGPTILQGLLGVCDDPLRVLRGFWPFPGCGSGRLVGCVQVGGSAPMPRLPGFFLLGGFSGTLLVVSVLGIVYDCHLLLLLGS